MPIYRSSERKFSVSSTSSLDRLRKAKFKSAHPRNRFKKRCWVQHKNASSEWMFISQDGDKMSFENNSHMTKNFQKLHTIGKGGFGTVLKVKHKIDSRFYAIKCILLDLMDTQSNKIMKEVKLLSRLIHDNIVRYFSTWIDDCTVDEVKADDEDTEGFSETTSLIKTNKSSDIVFQHESNISDVPPKSIPTQVLCIQMEFCKTTLADAINASNLYKKPVRAWKIFWGIVQGLAYLNKIGVIHRDLKPENIFLVTEDRVKIGDFGLATKIFRGSPAKGHIANSLSAEVGTSFYRAPELNLPEGSRTKYGQEVDIYSLGVILFEMFHPPFSTGSERCHVLTDLRKKDIIMPKEFKEDEKNAEVIDWIRLLLNHNANARPTCVDLLSKQKSKPLTNHRKSFQKQIRKKENINPMQQACAPAVQGRHGNGDIFKADNTVKDNSMTMRYIWYKEDNKNLQRGAITGLNRTLSKLQLLTTPKSACVPSPIEAVTLNEVNRAISIGYLDRQIRKFANRLVKFFNEIISLHNVYDIEYDLTDSDFCEAVDIIQEIWENVIAGRLAQLVWRNPCQFRSGVGTNGAINRMKVLMEKYRSVKQDVYLMFIRLEKNQVPPELMYTALRAEYVPERYIDLMKTVNFNIPTGKRRPTIENNEKPIVHQGSVLSPLLFNISVNHITRGLLDPATWTLMYGNNIVLAAETVVELQSTFSLWCEKLESGGLNVVRKDTEILCCNFSGAKIPLTVNDTIVLAGTLPNPLIDFVMNNMLK